MKIPTIPSIYLYLGSVLIGLVLGGVAVYKFMAPKLAKAHDDLITAQAQVQTQNSQIKAYEAETQEREQRAKEEQDRAKQEADKHTNKANQILQKQATKPECDAIKDLLKEYRNGN